MTRPLSLRGMIEPTPPSPHARPRHVPRASPRAVAILLFSTTIACVAGGVTQFVIVYGYLFPTVSDDFLEGFGPLVARTLTAVSTGRAGVLGACGVLLAAAAWRRRPRRGDRLRVFIGLVATG
ncbi:MAG: hypothetical protein GEV07_00360 [Streptosporangiales bacterium]|nr:hypothetical protein [Streptosporangiales bacterium]